MKSSLLLVSLLALSCAICADKTFEVTDTDTIQAWIVDGLSNPKLSATVGEQLTFNYTHISSLAHGLRIKDCACAGSEMGNLANVTNNDNESPSSPIDLVWTPSTPGTFYYSCNLHSFMEGEIIISAAPSEPSEPVPAPVDSTPSEAPTPTPTEAPTSTPTSGPTSAPTSGPTSTPTPIAAPSDASTLVALFGFTILSVAVHLL